MKRIALVVLFCALSAGCHAPMPNWNMFGPYGATRVPPPPTGGYGTPQPYYSPAPTTAPVTSPTSAPIGTGFRPSPQNRWSNIDDPAVGPVANVNTWAPTRPTSQGRVVDLGEVDVALANHETSIASLPSTVVLERDGPITIQSSPTATTSATLPRLRGMIVNDATRAGEPRRFVPEGRIVNMSDLPDAPIDRTSRATSSATVTSRSSATGGWKSRTTTLRVDGS